MKNKEVAFKTFEIYDKTIIFLLIFKDLNFYKGLILFGRIMFWTQFDSHREVIFNWVFELLIFCFH